MKTFLNGSDNTAGSDAVFFVVRLLTSAPIFGDIQQVAHAAGNSIRKQNDFAIEVPRGPACGLDQTCAAAKVALLVGVQDANQRHFGKIKPFAE